MDTVAITTTSSYNTTDHEEDICLPLKKPFLNAMMALPALVALENLFILLAMLSYKEKLKKRNLNMYVASTIAANFIIGTVTFYHFLNYYYGFESYQPNLWWAFRKGKFSVFFKLCHFIFLFTFYCTKLGFIQALGKI